MPQPPHSQQERRLAVFCRVSAVFYLVGAILFVLAPYLLAADPGPFSFWSVLAAALMTSIATSCLVAAGQPRERRHALLPVVIAALTVCVLGIVLHLGGMSGQLGLIAGSAPLFLLTLFIYRSAAPGVHSAPALEGPPPAPEEPADRKIQLGIKSN